MTINWPQARRDLGIALCSGAGVYIGQGDLGGSIYMLTLAAIAIFVDAIYRMKEAQ